MRPQVSSFLRLPRFERCLLLPAWGMLGVARAAVLLRGFPRLAPWLGRSVAIAPPLALDARAQRRALQIGRTLRLAARHTPWQSNCLAQALSARCLLGLFRVPHVICFGVARESGSARLHAHAWVLAGSVRVTGGAGAKHFTQVGCFLAPTRAAQ